MAVALSLLPALSAVGQTDDDQVTTTTLPEGQEEPEDVPEVDPGDPAVVIEQPGESPPPLDWTYRYMIPTAMLLAVVVILMTSIRYFTNVVRKRYRIVDE